MRNHFSILLLSAMVDFMCQLHRRQRQVPESRCRRGLGCGGARLAFRLASRATKVPSPLKAAHPLLPGPEENQKVDSSVCPLICTQPRQVWDLPEGKAQNILPSHQGLGVDRGVSVILAIKVLTPGVIKFPQRRGWKRAYVTRKRGRFQCGK